MVQLLSANFSHASEFSLHAGVLTIRGRINERDDQRLDDFVANKQINSVEITSDGGYVDAALRISDIINYRLALPLTVRGDCLSACAFIALAATRRLTVPFGSYIAVHEPWVGNGTPDPDVAKTVISWLRNCGVTESILKKIMNTKPANMLLVSTEELRAMGATVPN